MDPISPSTFSQRFKLVTAVSSCGASDGCHGGTAASQTNFNPQMGKALAFSLVWLVVGVLSVWAMAALYVDVRLSALKVPLTIVYAVTLLAIVIRYKLRIRSALLCLGCFCLVLTWWLNMQPINTARWLPDVDRLAWAQMDGDRVILHNFRNCDYQTETTYTNCWSDRTVHLSDLRGADLFFDTWGCPTSGIRL
jgi:hypothetical protein